MTPIFRKFSGTMSVPSIEIEYLPSSADTSITRSSESSMPSEKKSDESVKSNSGLIPFSISAISVSQSSKSCRPRPSGVSHDCIILDNRPWVNMLSAGISRS